MNLTATSDAIKIPGWRHDPVSLTYIGGNICAAKFNRFDRMHVKIHCWRQPLVPLTAVGGHLCRQPQALALVPQGNEHGGPSIMERFKRMAPSSFKGESDPLLAESWMREIEKIFRAIRCAEEDKVSLATYMLQERADVWWASLLRTRFEDGAIEVAWDEFVRLFRAKFILEHIQDKME
ncbi:hypothetical protein Taro_052061 [Colocasia esculenta]|uniref:Retrotransposon gag domain-containing protein n=1 Tax=Colocasia esculenta TaxID=4460 RepID=A0A843XIM5_COLES|nr:hypothetical protein [Colocasia esculenta]